MVEERNLAYYVTLIQQAQSYQDLVFLRNKVFDVIEKLLPAKDVEAIKRAWTERAKDETLPVVPTGQGKTAES